MKSLLTVVLWDVFPRIISAPTFGSFPLFLTYRGINGTMMVLNKSRLQRYESLIIEVLTGKPSACSMYTKSRAVEGTALFWYDCLEWNWRTWKTQEEVISMCCYTAWYTRSPDSDWKYWPGPICLSLRLSEPSPELNELGPISHHWVCTTDEQRRDKGHVYF